MNQNKYTRKPGKPKLICEFVCQLYEIDERQALYRFAKADNDWRISDEVVDKAIHALISWFEILNGLDPVKDLIVTQYIDEIHDGYVLITKIPE